MTTTSNKEPALRITESRGLQSFDRIGRPTLIADQSSNGGSSVLLNWTEHVKMWNATQVKHGA